ncbi:MAG: 50S ribosomal protein L3 [Rickettsiales bacterium]|jgi:large subunit ribosomal protein L3|nr:50S ribosomal protein L3 [Rickettsiales bacterium]
MLAVIGKKLGMTRLYLEGGLAVPVTLVRVYDSLISDFKTYADRNFNHVTLSYGKDKKTENRIGKAVLGFYKKKELEAYDSMKTFKVEKGEEFSVGSFWGIDHLVQNAKVDVTGVSKGKGFAGVVKKFGFRGQLAQHGSSLSHRSLGGTGSRRREGKVFRGKKMAGRMGSEKVTIKNLEIVRIESENSVLCLKGAVPGSRGMKLIIRSSII